MTIRSSQNLSQTYLNPPLPPHTVSAVRSVAMSAHKVHPTPDHSASDHPPSRPPSGRLSDEEEQNAFADTATVVPPPSSTRLSASSGGGPGGRGSAIALVTTRKQALDEQHQHINEQRSEALSSDVKYNRQQQIIRTVLLPDVGVRRSEAELAHFIEADKIVALYDSVSLKNTRNKQYPGLAFRFAYQKGSSLGFLETRTTMRCRALDVVAMLFDFDDFETVKLLESLNNHSFVFLLDIATPSPLLLPRQFVNICIWRMVEINAASLSRSTHPDSVTAIYEIVYMPTTHSSAPETDSVIRGLAYEVVFMYEHSSSSKIEYICYVHTDPRGYVPHFVVNSTIIQNYGARILYRLQVMQGRRLLDELDERDGAAMGEAFVLAKRGAHKGDTASTAVFTVVEQHVALRQAAAIHPR